MSQVTLKQLNEGAQQTIGWGPGTQSVNPGLLSDSLRLLHQLGCSVASKRTQSWLTETESEFGKIFFRQFTALLGRPEN